MKSFLNMAVTALLATTAHSALAQTTPQTMPPATPPAADAPAESTPPDTSTPQAAPQPAKPAMGDVVHDKNGLEIGTVSKSNDTQVEVTTARGPVTIPANALYTGAKGLAINMTKDEVDTAVRNMRAG